jgi:hypothetical protein
MTAINKTENIIIVIEKRFKLTCKLKQDISCYPLFNNISTIQINKEKSKEFSEVFTPLWLVDQMIGQVKFNGINTKTLDLCAGYGQFSVRLIRYLFSNYADFSIAKFIRETHAFSELQISSCWKLLNIFGNQINLFIGDSTNLNKLPPDATGIWCYIENYGYWVCLTKTVQMILSPNGTKSPSISEKSFVKTITGIIQTLNETHILVREVHNLSFKNITATSKQRLEIISELNSACKDNSKQNIDTPQSTEWITLYWIQSSYLFIKHLMVKSLMFV